MSTSNNNQSGIFNIDLPPNTYSIQVDNDELDSKFCHDPSDDTYCLMLWMNAEDKKRLSAFCRHHSVNPVSIAFIGIQTIIDATQHPDKIILVVGLTNNN